MEWNSQDNFTANCVGMGVRWGSKKGAKQMMMRIKTALDECIILGRIDGKCLAKDS